MTAATFRPLTFGVTRVTLKHGVSGTQYLSAEQALGDYPVRITDRLQYWAATAPERSFMAKREKLADGTTGDWQHISYAQAWARARCIAQALIHRGLSADKPVAILSENDLDYALLALGCMVAGVPFVPVSPAYSLSARTMTSCATYSKPLPPDWCLPLMAFATPKPSTRRLRTI